MNVIFADWELENLNKKTYEINIDSEEDNINKIREFEKEKQPEYIVLKIPTKYAKNFLQEINSYKFIETQFTLVKKLKYFDKREDFSNRYALKKIDEENEINNLISFIDDDMFKTDRIALDKEFGVKVANRRYKNWIKNGQIKGNEIYFLMKNNKQIGFLMTSIKENTANILLGGIFNKFQGMGHGYGMVYKPIELYKEKNYDYLQTKVSSNNFQVLKIYLSLGYEIKNIEYVYIKHKTHMRRK